MERRAGFSWLVELIVVAVIFAALVGVTSLTSRALIRHSRARKPALHVPASAAAKDGIWHKQPGSGGPADSH